MSAEARVWVALSRSEVARLLSLIVASDVDDLLLDSAAHALTRAVQ